jgi:metallo-beta-lactamase class B
MPRILLFLSAAAALFAQGNSDMHREFPAFKIAGNLYYVGTADLAVYLINTPQGNIVINTDYKQDLPTVKHAIESLGFKYGDTKILLISHAHGDHDEATEVVRKETGAKLMVMDADVPDEESAADGRPGAHVDRVLHDGETVELGGSKMVAHLTPGHTKGCTTWTMKVQDGGKTYNVVILGSIGVNPGYVLVGNKDYPQISDDYVRGFKTLRSLPCDVFLGSHARFYNMHEKYEQMAKVGANGPNPFIDPAGYKAHLDLQEKNFREKLAEQLKAAR